MRIRALLLTVFVIAGLALVACAPAPQPAAPAEQATTAATEAATTEAAATEAATTEAATTEADGRQATAAAAEESAGAAASGNVMTPSAASKLPPAIPIKIGYALVTSGPNSTLGGDSLRGIEIAVDDLGGELLGHPLEITGEDSGCDPQGGQTAATKLASDTSLVADRRYQLLFRGFAWAPPFSPKSA